MPALSPARPTLTSPFSLETASGRRAKASSGALALGPEDAGRGNLVLIDPAHPVPDVMRRERLVAPFADLPEVLLAKRASSALRAAILDTGYESSIAAASGFRSRERQQELWDGVCLARGEKDAARYVARPGASEHECGLAIDLARRWPVTGAVRLGFPRRGSCQRLREALPSYGFVERYPIGKEAVTGIAEEPWHFRYVGAPHALAMSRLGLCLEEWLELLANEAPLARPLAVTPEGDVAPVTRRRSHDRGCTLIACVSVEGPCAITLPRTISGLPAAPYATVSGTNCGSVVITWPA